MSNNPISRVHYFERQFLRTQEFTDEQAYHVAMRRRHNIAHHTWGIVHGLELEEKEGNLFVKAGMAVDGFGRELILPTKQQLSTDAFASRDSNVLNVWLMYNRTSSDQAPPGYAGCGDDGDTPFYRWQEKPWIWLEAPDPAFPDPRQPESVPVGDLDFDASRTPPDDPEQDWPVFLGQMLYDPANPDQPYSVDMRGRPYAGLVGEVVVAPSGQAQVQIGAESQEAPRRFAVFVLDPHAAPDADKPDPRLEIDKEGQVVIRGDTTLDGNLTVDKGAIEFKAGTARSQDASSWHIYHLTGVIDPDDPETLKDDLRIEMPGGTPGNNRVVIGTWSAEDKEFKPCLTIADDCSVTVHGNLIMEGRIQEGADLVEEQFSPEAKRQISTSFKSGIARANLPLPGLGAGLYRLGLKSGTSTAMRVSPETTLQAVTEHLAKQPGHLLILARLIKDQGLEGQMRDLLAQQGDEGGEG